MSVNPGRLPLGPRPPEVPNWMVNRGQYKLLCKVRSGSLKKNCADWARSALSCHCILYCFASVRRTYGRAMCGTVPRQIGHGQRFVVHPAKTGNLQRRRSQDFTCTFRSPAASHTPGRRRVRLRRNPVWLRSGTRKQAGFSKPVLHHVTGMPCPEKPRHTRTFRQSKFRLESCCT